MTHPYPIPRARLTAADLDVQRRRRDFDAGAAGRIYELAEREALQSIRWGHPAGIGPDDLDLAAAEEAKRVQRRLAAYRDGYGCCESSANLPDDDREVLGLPLSDYGTLPGPREGHPLREPRAAVTWRRGIVGLIVLGLAAALVYGLVRVWMP